MQHFRWRFGILSFFAMSLLLGVSGNATGGVSGSAALLPDDGGTVLQFHSEGHVLGFTPEKVYMVGPGYALIEEFVGASVVIPLATPSQDATQTSAPQPPGKGDPSFHGVSYPGLWEGITLRYERVSGSLAESVYEVSPGANAENIRLRYNTDFAVLADGGLQFRHSTKSGHFSLSKPKAWQEIGGRKIPVDVAFKEYGDRTVGFAVGSWDPEHPLMIDPTYQWHTFFGSTRLDFGCGIAVAGGAVYVTGVTLESYDVDGIKPKHAYSGSQDIVVLKLDTDGNYLWHTFYGGIWDDFGAAIAVRGDGLYVTGYTQTSWDVDGIGPKHPYGGARATVVLKLDTDGNYQWHTFFGAGDPEWDFNEGRGIAAASDGVYVAGISDASWDVDGIQPKHPHSGARNIAVLKLDTDGNYQWHTFYGSGDWDEGRAVAVTGNELYVTGFSIMSWSVNGIGPKHALTGFYDIMVLKLDTGGNYQWHTFYGSESNYDEGHGIAATEEGVFVTGQSYAPWNADGIGPLHPYSGYDDIVILKLNPRGCYQWHTFYGSELYFDDSRSIAVAYDGVYVTGYSGTSWNVDGTGPAHAHSGDFDFMVLKLDTDGGYRWHTFYGSSNVDGGRSIAISGDGVYVTGDSVESWNADGIEPKHAFNGDFDIVVLKLSDPEPLDIAPPTETPTLGEWGMGTMILVLGLAAFVALRRRRDLRTR